MTRKRKSLDETLAHQFVYGKTESNVTNDDEVGSEEEVESKEETSHSPLSTSHLKKAEILTSQNNQFSSKIIDKLQLAPKEATKRFTVDLSESLHRKLSILSAQTGRSKADIVRMLLEEALSEI